MYCTSKQGKYVVKRSIAFLAMALLAIGICTSSWAGINDGLIAYYRFDGNANDSSGNGYDGTSAGGVIYTASKIGSAAVFDGVGTHVQLPSAVTTLRDSGAKTISAWVNVPAGVSERDCAGWGSLRSIVDSSAAGHWRVLGIQIQNGQYYPGVVLQSHSVDLRASSPITTDTWHMLTFVWSPGAPISLYVDGALAAESQAISSWDTVTGETYIGRQYQNPCGHYFKGAIDDLRIYKRALSASEIRTLSTPDNAQSSNVVDIRSYIPAGMNAAGYNGFLRIINTSATATPVTVGLIDQNSGKVVATGTLTSALPPGAAVTYSAATIENALGMTPGSGDRPRIRVTTQQPVEIQSFMANPGGVTTQLSGAQSGTTIDVRSYLPYALNTSGYVSYLRVINTGSSATAVRVALIDGDTGVVGTSAALNSALPPGAAVTYSGQQVEAALGARPPASARPRLRVTSTTPIEVQSFMSNPPGVVTDSDSAVTNTGTVDVRSYIPAGMKAAGYNGFLRIINTSATATPVTVGLIDQNSGKVVATGTLTSALPPGTAVTYSADTIENALGMSPGAGDRPRIRVTTQQPVEVQSFMANPGGVMTQLSGAQSGTTIDVRSYLPYSLNTSGYVSYLRVINTGSSATAVRVALIDGDTGVVGTSAVLNAALPAGAAITYSGQQVEAALGVTPPASARPRLRVTSTTPIEVQSFMSNPTGVVTESDSVSAPADSSKVVSAQKTISGSGGTIEVTDRADPLYGIKIDVPPNAMTQPVDISISRASTQSPKLLGTSVVGETYVLSPGGTTFGDSVKITLPFRGTQVPLVVSYDSVRSPSSILPIHSIDYANGKVTVLTNHFSEVQLEVPTNSSSSYFVFDSGFDLAADVFAIGNNEKDLAGTNAGVKGGCWGFSAFSKWYFDIAKSSDGRPLNGRFSCNEKYVVSDAWESQTLRLRVERLWDAIVDDDYENFWQLALALRATGKPQMLGLQSPLYAWDKQFEWQNWKHSVLVTKLENVADSPDKIALVVYDNNNYDSAVKNGPAYIKSPIYFNKATLKFETYDGAYNKFRYMGDEGIRTYDDMSRFYEKYKNASCSDPINGACGSANGTNVSSAPTSNLCSAGSATTPTGTGPWIWTCNGGNGGTNDTSCYANKTVTRIDAACGSANGSTVSSAPTANLCAAGSATEPTGSGPWSWSCIGIGGGRSVIGCYANRAIVPIDGACGSAKGTTVSSVPTTNLCSAGSATTRTGSGPWYWNCIGSNGGTNDSSCYANKAATPINGTCGSAKGTTLSSQPTANLCAAGSATVPTGNGPWYWGCSGAYGGSSDSSCYALKGTLINGACGSAKGITVSSKPAANLCAAGSATAPTGTGPWYWSCSGAYGGTTDNSCYANKGTSVNGGCGSANGTNVSSAPTANLCSAGSATTPTEYGGYLWVWNCDGAYGGTSSSCQAQRTINGTCGSANGVPISSRPNSNLCSTGQASYAFGSGPWNWFCYGISGGIDASCSANTTAPPVATPSMTASVSVTGHRTNATVSGGERVAVTYAIPYSIANAIGDSYITYCLQSVVSQRFHERRL